MTLAHGGFPTQLAPRVFPPCALRAMAAAKAAEVFTQVGGEMEPSSLPTWKGADPPQAIWGVFSQVGGEIEPGSLPTWKGVDLPKRILRQ